MQLAGGALGVRYHAARTHLLIGDARDGLDDHDTAASMESGAAWAVLESLAGDRSPNQVAVGGHRLRLRTRLLSSPSPSICATTVESSA